MSASWEPPKGHTLAAGEPRTAAPPEHRLLVAVLERALLDLRAYSRRSDATSRSEVAQINEWFGSDYCGATYGGFSFLYVCAHLSLEPEFVRGVAREGVRTPVRDDEDEIRATRKIG